METPIQDQDTQNQQPEGCEGGKCTEVHTTERAGAIIENVFLKNRKEMFNASALSAIKAAAGHGMPIDVTLTGGVESGRVAIISSPVVTNIIAELSVAGKRSMNMAASLAYEDKDGEREIIDLDDEDKAIVQLSINSSFLMPFIGAMVSSMTTHVEHGMRSIVQLAEDEKNNVDMGDLSPEVAPPCCDGGECHEGKVTGESIPFPGPFPSPMPSPEVDRTDEPAPV